MEALKIQVQILEAPLPKDAIQAALHYQITWRLQNHVIDLSLPGDSNALIINVDATKGTKQCTQIPRQSSKELVKILPDSWVTNHEKLRKPQKPSHPLSQIL